MSKGHAARHCRASAPGAKAQARGVASSAQCHGVAGGPQPRRCRGCGVACPRSHGTAGPAATALPDAGQPRRCRGEGHAATAVPGCEGSPTPGHGLAGVSLQVAIGLIARPSPTPPWVHSAAWEAAPRAKAGDSAGGQRAWGVAVRTWSPFVFPGKHPPWLEEKRPFFLRLPIP